MISALYIFGSGRNPGLIGILNLLTDKIPGKSLEVKHRLEHI
jgi:hypothetical protein